MKGEEKFSHEITWPRADPRKKLRKIRQEKRGAVPISGIGRGKIGTLPVSRGRSARKLEIRFFLGHISGSFPAEFTDRTTKQSTGREFPAIMDQLLK